MARYKSPLCKCKCLDCENCRNCSVICCKPKQRAPSNPRRGRTTIDTALRGPRGPRGLQGAVGSVGPAGTPGAQGLPGPTGGLGNTGPPGTPGPSGTNGLTGARGATGPMGDTGPRGATGQDGNTGAQGTIGATGQFDDEICSLFDFDYGRCGRFYDFGACPPSSFTMFDSCTINPGAGDEQIFNFAPALNLTDFHAFLQDTFEIFPVDSTTYFTRTPTSVTTFHVTVPGFGPTLIPVVRDNVFQILTCGDSGPGFTDCELFYSTARGPTGLRGAQGNTGAQGMDGMAAFMGDTGPTGLQGMQGATGIQGFQGMDGMAAFMGSTGSQGAMGPTGLMGLMGMTGAQGAQGMTGATGAQGTRGSIIECGSSFSGRTAASDALVSIPPLSTPPVGTEVGDFILTLDTSTVYSWDGANWEILSPQPTTPYVFFDVINGVLYDVTMQGSAPTVHVANEGDLFVGQGESYFLGPSGYELCDTLGDLCLKLGQQSIDCLQDVAVTGAVDGEYLCFTGGFWTSSNVQLTVEGADSATGAPNSSVTLNLPDTLRIFSPGTIVTTTSPGSALVEINANNLFSDTGIPSITLPMGPPDPTRPAVYLDKTDNSVYFWDETAVMWEQSTSSDPGATGAQGSRGFQGFTGAQGSQGFQGSTGSQGDQGITGPLGPQGFQGITGVAGVLNDVGDVDVPMPMDGEYLSFTGGMWVNSTINLPDLEDVTITDATGGEYLCFNGTTWVNEEIARQGAILRCGDFLSGISAPNAGSKPLVGPMVLGDLCLAINTGTLFEWDGATWEILNPQPDRPYFYLDQNTGDLYQLDKPGPTGPPSLVDGMPGDAVLTANSATLAVILGSTGWEACVNISDSLGNVNLNSISDVSATGAVDGDYLCYNGTNWIPSPVITPIGAGFSLFASPGGTIVAGPTPVSFEAPSAMTNTHNDPVLGATTLWPALGPGTVFSNPFPFPIRLDLSFHLKIDVPGSVSTVIEAFIDYAGLPGSVANQIYTSELIDYTSVAIPQTVSGSGIWTLAPSGTSGDSLELFTVDLGGVGPFPIIGGPTGGSKIYGHITRMENLSDFTLPL